MLHESEKANLQQTLERTRAAIGVFAAYEGELRLIRKGMAASAIRERIGEMVRLNRDTLAALQRKLTLVERALSTEPDHRDFNHGQPCPS